MKIKKARYNRSMKIMLNLPLATHRELIVSLTRQQHVKLVFIQQFIQRIVKIRQSNKHILRTILTTVKNNTVSTTRRNVRCIILLTTKNSFHDIEVSGIRI